MVLVPMCVAVVVLTTPAQFGVIMGAIVLVAALEWGQLLGAKPLGRALFVGAVGLSLLIAYQFPVLWQPICFFAVIFWLFALRWVVRFPESKPSWFQPKRLWFFGFCLLVPTWIAMIFLRHEVNHGYWVLYAMANVWVADTGAYFAGRAFGRRKLAPQVSPGKSVAGVVGGVAASVAISLLVAAALELSVNVAIWLTLATAIAALFSVLGDLFESMVKRSVGVKDSGHWLPGHGGILDRVDALTCALPLFTVIYIGFLAGRLV